MGKTVELFGLIVFQVFLGLILTTAYLTKQATSVAREFSRESVAMFVNTFSDVSGSNTAALDNLARATFLVEHLKEDGIFKNTVRYKTEWADTNERILSVGKSDYIKDVLEGRKNVNQYESMVKIESITLNPDRRSATVHTTNYERGMIPMKDEMGDTLQKPLASTAYCEQTIVLNEKNIMQVANSVCTTDLAVAE